MLLEIPFSLTDSPMLNGMIGSVFGTFLTVLFTKIFENSETISQIAKKPFWLMGIAVSFFLLGMTFTAPSKPEVKPVVEEVIVEPEEEKPEADLKEPNHQPLENNPPPIPPIVDDETKPQPSKVSLCSKISKSTYAVVGTFDGSQNDKLAREFAGVIPGAINFNPYYFMESTGSPESFLSQNDLRDCVDWLVEVELTSVGEEYTINLRKVRVDNQQSESVGELTREFLERGEERAISTFVKWFKKKHLKDFPRK